MRIKIGNVTITNKDIVETDSMIIGALPPRIDGKKHSKTARFVQKLKRRYIKQL